MWNFRQDWTVSESIFVRFEIIGDNEVKRAFQEALVRHATNEFFSVGSFSVHGLVCPAHPEREPWAAELARRLRCKIQFAPAGGGMNVTPEIGGHINEVFVRNAILTMAGVEPAFTVRPEATIQDDAEWNRLQDVATKRCIVLKLDPEPGTDSAVGGRICISGWLTPWALPRASYISRRLDSIIGAAQRDLMTTLERQSEHRRTRVSVRFDTRAWQPVLCGGRCWPDAGKEGRWSQSKRERHELQVLAARIRPWIGFGVPSREETAVTRPRPNKKCNNLDSTKARGRYWVPSVLERRSWKQHVGQDRIAKQRRRDEVRGRQRDLKAEQQAPLQVSLTQFL